MNDLSEEDRRRLVRDAGEPKKGHHWAILQDNHGKYSVHELKTQFRSTNGDLVAERVSREWYGVRDRSTSYLLASVPGRTYAKGLIEELGPVWAEKMKLRSDPEVVRGIRAICAKYKAKHY